MRYVHRIDHQNIFFEFLTTKHAPHYTRSYWLPISCQLHFGDFDQQHTSNIISKAINANQLRGIISSNHSEVLFAQNIYGMHTHVIQQSVDVYFRS